MQATVSYLNPDGLHHHPAFTQVVTISGPTRTVYVGGQNAVDASGAIVGGNDMGAQAAQVAKNLRIALAAAEARVDHIVKWTVYLVHGQPVGPAMGAFQQVFGVLRQPPTIAVVFVAALARPELLIEVDAIAVVPES